MTGAGINCTQPCRLSSDLQDGAGVSVGLSWNVEYNYSYSFPALQIVILAMSLEEHCSYNEEDAMLENEIDISSTTNIRTRNYSVS